jgi:hypothetical protein
MAASIARRSATSVAAESWPGLLFVWLVVLLVGPAAEAQAPIRKNVLIINEVGLAHPASALVTEEVMSRQAADAGNDLVVGDLSESGSVMRKNVGVVRQILAGLPSTHPISLHRRRTNVRWWLSSAYPSNEALHGVLPEQLVSGQQRARSCAA